MNNKLQWKIFYKIKRDVLNWCQKNLIDIYEIFFIPHEKGWPYENGYPSEIYIFYHTDVKVMEHEKSGVTEQIRLLFINGFSDKSNYEGIEDVDENIELRFEFDSDENVKKNYEGSYYFRLH
jgi:hypothetical protein